jgi:F0F1-type ATP synthase epsilon subunit
MKLTVVSPNPKLIKGVEDLAWIELDTPVGNFVILPEHAPTVLTLKKNSIVRYGLKSGKQDSIDIVDGLAHIKRDQITLLLNE